MELPKSNRPPSPARRKKNLSPSASPSSSSTTLLRPSFSDNIDDRFLASSMANRSSNVPMPLLPSASVRNIRTLDEELEMIPSSDELENNFMKLFGRLHDDKTMSEWLGLGQQSTIGEDLGSEEEEQTQLERDFIRTFEKLIGDTNMKDLAVNYDDGFLLDDIREDRIRRMQEAHKKKREEKVRELLMHTGRLARIGSGVFGEGHFDENNNNQDGEDEDGTSNNNNFPSRKRTSSTPGFAPDPNSDLNEALAFLGTTTSDVFSNNNSDSPLSPQQQRQKRKIQKRNSQIYREDPETGALIIDEEKFGNIQEDIDLGKYDEYGDDDDEEDEEEEENGIAFMKRPATAANSWEAELALRRAALESGVASQSALNRFLMTSRGQRVIDGKTERQQVEEDDYTKKTNSNHNNNVPSHPHGGGKNSGITNSPTSPSPPLHSIKPKKNEDIGDLLRRQEAYEEAVHRNEVHRFHKREVEDEDYALGKQSGEPVWIPPEPHYFVDVGREGEDEEEEEENEEEHENEDDDEEGQSKEQENESQHQETTSLPLFTEDSITDVKSSSFRVPDLLMKKIQDFLDTSTTMKDGNKQNVNYQTLSNDELLNRMSPTKGGNHAKNNNKRTSDKFINTIRLLLSQARELFIDAADYTYDVEQDFWEEINRENFLATGKRHKMPVKRIRRESMRRLSSRRSSSMGGMMASKDTSLSSPFGDDNKANNDSHDNKDDDDGSSDQKPAAAISSDGIHLQIPSLDGGNAAESSLSSSNAANGSSSPTEERPLERRRSTTLYHSGNLGTRGNSILFHHSSTSNSKSSSTLKRRASSIRFVADDTRNSNNNNNKSSNKNKNSSSSMLMRKGSSMTMMTRSGKSKNLMMSSSFSASASPGNIDWIPDANEEDFLLEEGAEHDERLDNDDLDLELGITTNDLVPGTGPSEGALSRIRTFVERGLFQLDVVLSKELPEGKFEEFPDHGIQGGHHRHNAKNKRGRNKNNADDDSSDDEDESGVTKIKRDVKHLFGSHKNLGAAVLLQEKEQRAKENRSINNAEETDDDDKKRAELLAANNKNEESSGKKNKNTNNKFSSPKNAKPLPPGLSDNTYLMSAAAILNNSSSPSSGSGGLRYSINNMNSASSSSNSNAVEDRRYTVVLNLIATILDSLLHSSDSNNDILQQTALELELIMSEMRELKAEKLEHVIARDEALGEITFALEEIQCIFRCAARVAVHIQDETVFRGIVKTFVSAARRMQDFARDIARIGEVALLDAKDLRDRLAKAKPEHESMIVALLELADAIETQPVAVPRHAQWRRRALDELYWNLQSAISTLSTLELAGDATAEQIVSLPSTNAVALHIRKLLTGSDHQQHPQFPTPSKSIYQQEEEQPRVTMEQLSEMYLVDDHGRPIRSVMKGTALAIAARRRLRETGRAMDATWGFSCW